MRVSFDFDGTLDLPNMQELARVLLLSGHEVKITTARCPNFDNRDLWALAGRIGIDQVDFVCQGFKHDHLDGWDIHFDDCIVTCHEINRKHPGRAVLVRAEMNPPPDLF